MSGTSTKQAVTAALQSLGISEEERCVPRQVTIMPVDVPEGSVKIYAVAMGVEVDTNDPMTIRIAITGGLRNGNPLRLLQLQSFVGDSLRWRVIPHNGGMPFLAKVTLGPPIGLVLE